VYKNWSVDIQNGCFFVEINNETMDIK